MVLYTIKNLLPIKDMLKTLQSSGINNYIKVLQRQCSRKTAVKELGKMEQDKTVLKQSCSNVVFIEACLWYKIIYN